MHTKNSTQIQRNDLKNEVMISFQSSAVHFILVFIYFILLLIRKNMDREDKLSKMVLQSGHTKIVFDGTYGTAERVVNNNRYRVMTFNKSNNIEDAPDTKFVKRTDFYFPGTFIFANIIL